MCAIAGDDSELRSLRSTFYDEADERLLQLEALLLEMDGRPVDREVLDSVFRAVHSIKGGSAACELANIVRFAHTFESLLDALRKGWMVLDAEVVEVMLRSSDVLASLVHNSRNGDNETEGGATIAVERIRSVLERGTAPLPSERCEQELTDRGVMFFSDDDADVAAGVPSAGLRAAAPTLPSFPPALGLVEAQEASLFAERATASSDDEEDLALHASIAEPDLARMIALAIELQQSSARFADQLSAQSGRACVDLEETARQIATEVSELESLLTAARGSDSASLLECIVVRLGTALYAIPLLAVGRYFTPATGDLRTVPLLGRVLVSGAQVLPVLDTALAPEDEPVSEIRDHVAISLVLPSGPAVLLVDEVLTQVKLLMRSLQTNYRLVHGVLGAAPYGSRVLLVLDLETLSRRQRLS